MLKIKKMEDSWVYKAKGEEKRNFNGEITEIIYQIYQIYVTHFFY